MLNRVMMTLLVTAVVVMALLPHTSGGVSWA
jgi:hypothetical protein